MQRTERAMQHNEHAIQHTKRALTYNTERAMTHHVPHGQHRVRRAEPSLGVQLRADHRAADPRHPEDELARRVAVCGVLAVRAFLCSLSACLCPLRVCAHGKETKRNKKQMCGKHRRADNREPTG